MKMNQKRLKVKRRVLRRLFMLGLFAVLCLGCVQIIRCVRGLFANQESQRIQAAVVSGPDNLKEMYEKNPETADFVLQYANRKKYMKQKIDLSGEVEAGSVPLLMQWDRRWGYNKLGSGMIAENGCGPTCLSMAYIYLTGDTSMNPRRMSRFVEKSGYYQEAGTSWDLWTQGVRELGLQGETLSLDESVVKDCLDAGNVVICSMRPGDFTTTGHYILIRGYDENGFYVNDPNRKENSRKQWDFERLAGQMKNLWGIGRDAE